MKKRLLSMLLLLAATATGAWALTQDGDGYYLLSTAQDLTDFAVLVNSGSNTANAKVTQDITLTGTWSGINNYNGTFDGQGHTISGVSGNCGLFAFIGSDGTVKRVIVDGSIYSGDGAGGIANSNAGTITRCGFIGSVGGGRGTNNGYVAGIAAYSSGQVSHCFNRGTVSARYVGGIVGRLGEAGTVRYCYNAGQLSMDNIKVSSAIVGDRYGSVSNCYTLEGSAQHHGSEGVSGDVKTAEQFASGEVCYLLQSGIEDEQWWGQTIGTDAFPQLTSDEDSHVYYFTDGTYGNADSGKEVLRRPCVIWCADSKTLYFDYTERTNMAAGMTYKGNAITNIWYDTDVTAATGTTTYPKWYNTVKNVCTKVVFTDAFSQVKPTSCRYWFYNFSRVEEFDGLEKLNTSEVTTMFYMFTGCTNIKTLNLRNFDVQKVTEMNHMFRGCSQLAVIYCDKDWNTGNVTSSMMFSDCFKLMGAINYDSSKTDVNYANPTTGYFWTKVPYAVYCDDNSTLYFTYEEEPLTDTFLGHPITFKYGADIITSTIVHGNYSDWVGLMKSYNYTCTHVVFTESFKDVRPTNCRRWFFEMSDLEDVTGLEYLNMSETTTISGMFGHCSKLKSIDLSGLDTRNVTNMGALFTDCSALESIDVSGFDTQRVTIMSQMFYNCSSLKTIYCDNDWNTGNVLESYTMFYGCSLLKGAIAYDSDKRDINYANPTTGYFTSLSSLKPYVMWFEGNKTLYMTLSRDITYDRSVRKYFTYDGDEYTYDGQTITSLWDGLDVTNYGEDPLWELSSAERIVIDKLFKYVKPQNLSYFFRGYKSSTTIEGWENLNTSEATSMSYMFDGSEFTTLDLSHFNTSKVTDMSGMFRNCTSLRAIIVGDGWDTSAISNFNNQSLFLYNNLLVGEDGTKYTNPYNIGKYAHTGAGGYLTKKTVEVPMHDGGDGYYYGTYYKSNVNRVADESTEVYTGTVSSDGKELELTKVADHCIKAGQGVVLKRATAGNAILTSVVDEATGDFSTNALKGNDQATATSGVDGNIYVLSKKDGYDVGFYSYVGTTLDANKAYLALTGAAAPVLMFDFDGIDAHNGQATGVEKALEVATPQQESWFDLTGRRLSGKPATKGVYIVNGRKVFIH